MNTFAGSVGSSELTEVLFGDLAVLVNTETGQARDTRASNGIVWNGNGWINPRLDAIVVVNDLTPWTLGQRTFVQMVYPHKHPNGLKVPLPGPQLKLQNETVETIPRLSIREVLCLQARWPED